MGSSDAAQHDDVRAADMDSSPIAYARVPFSNRMLVVLLLVYTINSVDRSIVSILGQPIKEEFRLEDWQLGLMTGLGFSLLYVVFGFPLARLADRRDRVTILSVCLVVWSAMTALCGLSASFVQLLLCEMGVGAGEAGCMPTAHSLIADYFPPGKRASALAIFGLGLPLGGLVGIVTGGLVLDAWGWRTAFLMAGAAGLPLAIAVKLLVREPARGRFETPAAPGTQPSPTPSFGACVAYHVRSPVSRNILAAMTLLTMFTSSYSVFLAPYFVRKFGVSYSKLGLILAVSFMLGGAISTLGGGVLADRLGARDRRWYLMLPVIGLSASLLLFVATFLQPTLNGTAILLFFAAVTGFCYVAPCFAVLHNLSAPQMRATTTAIAQFLMNFVGMGLGPLLAGGTVDVLSRRLFRGIIASGIFPSDCPGGSAPPGSTPIFVHACHEALAHATQVTLIGFIALTAWPILHLYLAARALKGPPGQPLQQRAESHIDSLGPMQAKAS